MNNTDCLTIEQAAHDIAFNTIIFVKMLVCLCGVTFMIRQWNIHGTRFLGHVNSRVLFHCYYVMFLVHGSSMGSQYLLDFTRLRFTCVMLDFRLVIVLRGLCISSLLAAHLILIMMSLERLYSSLYPERYEKASAQKLTTTIALTLIVGATFFVIWNISNSFLLFTANFVALANTKVPSNTERYDQTVLVLSITSWCSLAIFLLDFYLNFYRKTTKTMSLGASYQLQENRRVILVLMPMEIIDSILTVASSISQLLYANYAKDASHLSRQIFLESTTFTQAFPLILAIIIEWKVGRRKRVIRPTENAGDHFDHLRRIWA